MQRHDRNEPLSRGEFTTGRALRLDRHLLEPSSQFIPLPDLGERESSAALTEWIRQEVEGLNWSNPQVEEYVRQHPEYRPKVMLNLLAYAYARRIFGSAEIVSACHIDPTFRNLCEGRAPFAAELWNFRRKNRAVLKKILAGVFRRALQANPISGASRFPSEPQLDACAEQRLDVARHMDAVD